MFSLLLKDLISDFYLYCFNTLKYYKEEINTFYCIPGRVHKDNLTSGQIVFIFKGNIINQVLPFTKPEVRV